MIFRKTNTFGLFEQIVDDYEDKTILDFGGNRGNLIATSFGKIKPENYTCLDISSDSLDLCKKENPGVKTILWNRYDRLYNPSGNDLEPFPKIGHYDIAFANSVFTHHKMKEILFCLDKLGEVSNKIYFTYIDPKNKQFFEKFEEKYGGVDWSKSKEKEVSYIFSNSNMLWTVVDTEYLKNQIYKNSNKSMIIDTGRTNWFDWMKIEYANI